MQNFLFLDPYNDNAALAVKQQTAEFRRIDSLRSVFL